MKDKYSIEVRKRYYSRNIGYVWDWRIVHNEAMLGLRKGVGLIKEYKSFGLDYIKTREAAVRAAKEALEEHILLNGTKYEWEAVDET